MITNHVMNVTQISAKSGAPMTVATIVMANNTIA
jgi:hypothetical protein